MTCLTDTLAFFGQLGWTELILLGAVAVLLFGNRLPELGRSLGKGIVEFKKGIKDVEKDIDQSSDSEKN